MGATYQKKSFKTLQRVSQQVADRMPTFDDVDDGGAASGVSAAMPTDETTETVIYDNSDMDIARVKNVSAADITIKKVVQ